MDDHTAVFEKRYNNRAAVPEFAQHFDRWTRLSKTARDELDSDLDIAYGDHTMEKIDIFRAEGRSRDPWVVCLRTSAVAPAGGATAMPPLVGQLNRPGIDGGSDSTKDEGYASTTEVSAGVAGASGPACGGGA